MLDGVPSAAAEGSVRLPTATQPPRMEPLATLPVFLDLRGRRAVLAGGGPPAAWKVELLCAAGAHVDVYAPHPGAELTDLAHRSAGEGFGHIEIHHRDWRPEDIAGAAVAIGAIADDDEASRFAGSARAAGVPVNVVDRPKHCDFQIGAIVNRSPLVIAISTNGAAPILAQTIRSEIEALLPSGLRLWVEAAIGWRARLRRGGLDAGGRRSFWQRFADRARREPGRAPVEADFADLLAESSASAGRIEQKKGRVTLVGAGPGDPGLMTLAAVRALRSADVVLYDDLVPAECLEFARREARRIGVGKTGHAPSCRQGDINACMVGLALAGHHVVRLKAGDPMIFGRASEELDALRNAGVHVSVVPGVTAAQAAAASLRVSLTERDLARRVQFVTGHARDGGLPGDIDWQALADPRATTAIYMPIGTLSEFMERLQRSGVEPTRPAAAVFNASRPAERVVVGTVTNLSERIADGSCRTRRSRPEPCLVLIGEVVSAMQSSATAVVQSELPRTAAQSQ